MAYSFHYKTINDPVHGAIGLSEVEARLIATPTFLRLMGLRQLGLTYMVFPGATHTRFAHSIGSMHVISRMIDAINNRCQTDALDFQIDDPTKQKLRLAALLHDVGHYPLSHTTESVFYQVANDKKASDQFEETDPVQPSHQTALNEMVSVGKIEEVSHEELSKKIVSKRKDIKDILETAEYDPDEIGKIITSEEGSNKLHSQLIHSTLDADRIDFLLRDSHFCGVSYGRVDINFIISNLRYDKISSMFAVDDKAIPAFEHYLLGRYFMYNNVYYHKTGQGFDLMASTLYYQMACEKQAVGDFNEVVNKMEEDAWFLRFDDSYFWRSLHDWNPEHEYHKDLREHLLERIPLRVLCEERKLVPHGESANNHFVLNQDDQFDSRKFNKLLEGYGLGQDSVAIKSERTKLEVSPGRTDYQESVSDEDKRELGRVYEDFEFKDLIAVEHGIIRKLTDFTPHIRRLYAFDRKLTKIERQKFKRPRINRQMFEKDFRKVFNLSD